MQQKFGPCECDAEDEEYTDHKLGDDAPGKVRAQYLCERCGTKIEMVPCFEQSSFIGTEMKMRHGWTDE